MPGPTYADPLLVGDAGPVAKKQRSDTSPAVSEATMSVAYSPFGPTSPTYSPTSPAYSQTSPGYEYDPQPVYEPEYEPVDIEYTARFEVFANGRSVMVQTSSIPASGYFEVIWTPAILNDKQGKRKQRT